MCVRVLLLAILLWAPVMTAAAQTETSTPQLDIPKSEYESARFHPLVFDNLAARLLSPSLSDRFGELRERGALDNTWHPAALSIGPLKFDIISAGRTPDGKQAHFAHVHLDGVHILGGQVSGSFDGRAAIIGLSWPTGH